MKRLIIDGVLAFQASFAVGGIDPSPGSDRPILLDQEQRPAVPGTTIAGALRSLLARLLPHVPPGTFDAYSAFDDLFGAAPEDEEDAGGAGKQGTRDAESKPRRRERPSRLHVGDGAPKDRVGRSLRDGVGIDRATGSAREGIKYDLELADAGARYAIRMQLDLQGHDDPARQLLLLGLREWAEGRGSLGGRAGTGLGAFRLEDLTVRELDLAKADTLEAWLRARPGGGDRTEMAGHALGELVDPWESHVPLVAASAGDADGTQAGSVRLVVELDFTDPLLVGGLVPAPTVSSRGKEIDPSGSDAQPVQHRVAGRSEPVLPGSSLRGVIRSRAERILRTVGSPGSCCDPNDKRSCGRSRGHAEERLRFEGASPRVRFEAAAARAGRLRNQSCPACRLFGHSSLGGRVKVTEASIASVDQEVLDHVAVDRFTGGAADTRKFDTAPLLGARAVAEIHLDRPERWELALVLLALRDLCEGWLPVGSRGSRGYGTVAGRVTEIDVRSVRGGPLEPLCDGEAGSWRAGTLQFPGPAFLGEVHPYSSLSDVSRALLQQGVDDLHAVAAAWPQEGCQ